MIVNEVRIIKKADDPADVTRVSLGGLGGPIPNGVYCVYRGTKQDAIQCLERALAAMLKMTSLIGDTEPDVQPDNGKTYA